MPGQGSLHGKVGRLAVAEFAHYDNVRILAQKRAQTARERHTGHRIDLRLVDANNTIFNRVFDGAEVNHRTVQLAEYTEQTGRFTGTGWTGDEYHAVRLHNRLLDTLQRFTPVAEFFERSS